MIDPRHDALLGVMKKLPSDFEPWGHVHDADDEATGAGRRDAEVRLLRNLRERMAELRAQLEASSDHWGYEDPVYRFYHQSFKVYWLQERTRSPSSTRATSSRWPCAIRAWKRRRGCSPAATRPC